MRCTGTAGSPASSSSTAARTARTVESRAIRVAPSQQRSHVIWGGLAKEMDADDISRIQREWVEAAKRARDVGFDIVYVYGAHGYLLSQFFSTHLNQRTDEYGGSLAEPGPVLARNAGGRA